MFVQSAVDGSAASKIGPIADFMLYVANEGSWIWISSLTTPKPTPVKAWASNTYALETAIVPTALMSIATEAGLKLIVLSAPTGAGTLAVSATAVTLRDASEKVCPPKVPLAVPSNKYVIGPAAAIDICKNTTLATMKTTVVNFNCPCPF